MIYKNNEINASRIDAALTQWRLAKKRHATIEALLEAPTMASHDKSYIALKKEYQALSKVVNVGKALVATQAQQVENQLLLRDEKGEELLVMAQQERSELESKVTKLQLELEQLLIGKQADSDHPVILEIRAGTGGDEAALWVGDLFRMYVRFAESQGWKVEPLSSTQGSAGGYKELICNISGHHVYGQLQYESGVHRVQRVPNTETQGRIHTSAASVVVLPEMDKVAVNIKMKEIRKETFCSSGPGGQSVNTTYSAVRLTHLPSGIAVSCQDEKSQLKNFDKALRVLRARLYDLAKREQEQKLGATRRSMIGSGDRSAKIRTYNYPQARVTDHRIHYTQHNLTAISNGALSPLIHALRMAEHQAKLEASKSKES